MVIKIALTIPTGRPQVKKVVDVFLVNAEHYGYDPKDFSVYLAIDTSYQNKTLEDFKLGADLEAKLGKVEYISEDRRNNLSDKMVREFGVDEDVARLLYSGNGYSKQRNAAFAYALMDGNDVAICFDDDEAPFIPISNERGETYWNHPDFFTPHLEALSNGADITKGSCLGYFSPIPSDFERDVPKDLRKRLGEVLALGNEVITGDSFLNLFMKQFKYLPEMQVSDFAESASVAWGKHGKPVPAGNMGINLNSIRKGIVPVFYTPPNARGEDTIFGLQLKTAEVRDVNSYIFHDPFGLHPEVLDGVFPQRPLPIPVTDDSKQRFASALTGWLKYAPILIAMTSEDGVVRDQRIDEMVDRVEEPTQTLAKILDYPQINDCKEVLRSYGANVERHLDELAKVQREWKQKIIPSLQQPI